MPWTQRSYCRLVAQGWRLHYKTETEADRLETSGTRVSVALQQRLGTEKQQGRATLRHNKRRFQKAKDRRGKKKKTTNQQQTSAIGLKKQTNPKNNTEAFPNQTVPFTGSSIKNKNKKKERKKRQHKKTTNKQKHMDVAYAVHTL